MEKRWKPFPPNNKLIKEPEGNEKTEAQIQTPMKQR
jgi:hypothetical protein